ncbi:MAG: DsbA family protein [Microthrixaceae bacterium]
MTTHLVIYGDFNCPYSCLASFRADRLVDAGIAEIEWRAVEHDPSIPVPSNPAEGELCTMLDREVAEVRGMLQAGEVFPIERPTVQPNTARAVAAYAAADVSERDRLRRSLFSALWFDGLDTGALEVLRRLGAEPTAAAPPLVSTWRDAWQGLDRHLVPMLVLPDGYVSRGLGALARLADLSA